jgi:hypothetical protein
MELSTGTSDKARLAWECHTVSLFVAWMVKSTPYIILEVFSRPGFSGELPNLLYLPMREAKPKSIISRIS